MMGQNKQKCGEMLQKLNNLTNENDKNKIEIEKLNQIKENQLETIDRLSYSLSSKTEEYK